MRLGFWMAFLVLGSGCSIHVVAGPAVSTAELPAPPPVAVLVPAPVAAPPSQHARARPARVGTFAKPAPRSVTRKPPPAGRFPFRTTRPEPRRAVVTGAPTIRHDPTRVPVAVLR